MTSAFVTTAAPYAGADRRQRPLRARDSISRRNLITFAVALVVVGLILPMALSHAAPDTATSVQLSLRAMWGMLFVCAGVFRLVRWRLSGEARAAWLGVAITSFGLLAAPTPALAPLMHSAVRDERLSPVTRVVAVVACFVFMMRFLREPQINSRLRPMRAVVTTVTAGWLLLLLCIAASAHGHPLTLPNRVWFGVGMTCAAGWLVLAVTAGMRGMRRNSASMIWISAGLLLLATAEALHAAAFVVPTTVALYSTCLHLVVGALAAGNAAADLELVFSADGNHMLTLTGALAESERQLTREEARRNERLHDARSVIAALKATSFTLDRYDERLEAELKHRLRSSLVSELTRLENVLEDRRREPLEVFTLGTALMPVLMTERQQGMTITNQLGSLRAQGRPLELATVVQNLLVNARRYAPGSAVRVHASGDTRTVHVVVDDRGPGIDPADHNRVFERGYRSAAQAGGGSGLGLFLSRRLMREMGGDLVLRDRAGGGARFILTLPAASAQTEPNDLAQIGAPANHAGHVTTAAADARQQVRIPGQRDHDVSMNGGGRRVGPDHAISRREWRVGRRTTLDAS